ncbi:formamidopyrimidine-DNA glycosylase [Methanocella sp. CWC-04]|uniref:Formamidopyrimidine-DNA glycosylase n=1 Tax=Methanooceanicella nereidis TaxID=2052831 RepID=A0AAP2RFB5_9EURY|nr:DNA-formamidopyrimidine glycosylase family protein [Methanocella sp. CWC-04]MCD1295535.1 formamidopyrimidine-DNA glycosylase [Methanocella sp. CWC-04]
MPELPEIFNLAGQMGKELEGKTVQDVEIRQHKCLNVTPEEFKLLVCGKKLSKVTSKGKWILVKLYPDAYFLLSLGMGGNLLYHEPGQSLPDKYQLSFSFDDGSHLSIGFWWFGYAHAVNALDSHKMTSKLGMSPVSDEFTYDRFNSMLRSKKGAIKSVLMDQSSIAGIGNVYVQDILFKARLHPERKVPEMTEKEKTVLYDAIKDNLLRAVSLGGIAPEKDLYGNPGRFTEFMVGYREGKPCPECGTTIEKIKTGSTSSYICPACQR